jgi:hypothetical protein
MSAILKTNSNNNHCVEVVLTSLDPTKRKPIDAKKMESIRQITKNFSLTSAPFPVEILALRIQDLCSQKIVGTLYARVMNNDTLSLDLLFVDEENRNQKIGSRLLDTAENYAYKLKAKKITLCTYDFQAPEFYEKKGYRRVSHIKNALDHHSMIFLEKTLQEYSPSTTDIDLKNLKVKTYSKENLDKAKATSQIALEGILSYNHKILQAESQTERDFVEFALVLCRCNPKNQLLAKAAPRLRRNTAQFSLSLENNDKEPPGQIPDSSNCFDIKGTVKSDQILGVITGFLVTGSENNAIVLDGLGFKNEFENDSDIHREMLEGLEALGIEHKCLNLLPYDQEVQKAFDLLASSKRTQLTFRRITLL